VEKLAQKALPKKGVDMLEGGGRRSHVVGYADDASMRDI